MPPLPPSFCFRQSARFRHASWSLRRARSARRQGAFTLLETAVAGALLTLFLSSVFALNSVVMQMLRSANETADASQELQTRIEQIRLANWVLVTSPAYVKGTLLAAGTDATTGAFSSLPGMSETLTAAPYMTTGGSGASAFGFKRTGAVITALSGSGADLSKQSLVQFTISVNWSSWGGRQRTRTLTTVVSRWGVSK